MKYLLDTDHISILQNPKAAYHQQLTPRALANAGDIVVSMASLHEQAMGCNTYIARARSPEGVAHGYDLLRRVLETFSNFSVMPFDLQAANEFETLRAA